MNRLELPADNPRYKASPLSVLFFSWLDSLIWTGYKRELKQEDLYATPDDCRSQVLLKEFKRYWDPEVERQKHKGQEPRLWLVLLKCFNWIYFICGVMHLAEASLFIIQAVLVGYMSQYYCEKKSLEKELSTLRNDNDTELISSKEEEIQIITRNAYFYATGIAIIAFIVLLNHAWLVFLYETLGMKHRVLFIAAIYEKVLHFSHSTIGKLSVGHIINVVSTDVQRFDLGFNYIHIWWIFLLLMPVVVYLLWRELGPSCLVGVGLILIQPPLQYAMARLHIRLWLKSARLTDKRVKVMNEIISGMRLIKMYAWEWAFHEYIKNIRTKESRTITQASLIRGLNQACFSSLLSILNFVTFSTYTGLGNVLTPRKVFTVITLFSIMRLFFYFLLVLGALGMSEIWVSLKRIKKLLILPVLTEILNCDGLKTTNGLCSNSMMPTRKLIDEELINESESRILRNKVVLPRVLVSGLTASWTHEKQKLVLNKIDFSLDQSNRLLAIVGPVGSGKSSLLKCVLQELQLLNGSVDIEGTVSYASQEPWIFSGTLKENILFGKPFDQAWFDRVVESCCLVKDIKEMPFGDETLIGERGVNLSSGQKARVNLARAVYRDSEIILLDDPLSAVDAAVSRHLFDRCIYGVLADKLVLLVTHQLQYAQHANSILVLKEGCVQGYGSYDELTTSGIDSKELFDDIEDKKSKFTSTDVVIEEYNDATEETSQECIISNHMHLLPMERTRFVGSRHSMNITDSSSTQAADKQSIRTTPSMFSLISMPNDSESNTNIYKHSSNVIQEEERAHGTISAKTYLMFFKEGVKNHFATALIIVFFLLVEGCIVCGDWWIADWASQSESCLSGLAAELNFSADTSDSFSLSTYQRIGIYGGITIFSVFVIILRVVLCYLIILAASRSLHNKMLTAILRAPVLFFDTNPVGRVLNRFSKDLGFIDAVLPYQFVEFLNFGLRCTAVVVTACVANYWLSIIVAIIFILLVGLRHYFLRASRSIQRLEALAVFITFLVFTSIPLSDVLDPALVGLSIAYSVSLSNILQYSVRLSAEAENLMVSVERVMAYGKLSSEKELKTISKEKVPHIKWPDKGVIELSNISFKYALNYPYVLKSISLKIGSCEKIGIVGRTGAGKSSLLSALFRLAEPEGVFEIDGIQITQIGLHDLRKKISIIPQDPILFSGTVRYNLDPFREYENHQLWDALEEVQLKHTIANMNNGLEAEVSEGGSNFSVGQRQLMCLARALLRRNKILVIDEATANVDLITDGIIQEMIHNKFSHCTILTIAHRLETIMDSDRVLVLSFGKVIEFDAPFNLLQNHDSLFHSMVKKTGVTESERLKKIAIAVEKSKLGTRI